MWTRIVMTVPQHSLSKEILKSNYAPDNSASSSSTKLVDAVLASGDEDQEKSYERVHPLYLVIVLEWILGDYHRKHF